MNGEINLLTLLSLVVALVAIVKLRSVLGRRTGDEESRIERRRREAKMQNPATTVSTSDKVVALPRRDREVEASEYAPTVSSAEVEARIKTLAGSDATLADGLVDILKLDQAFDPEHFLRGARQAYEMIVTAFAKGDIATLRSLLGDEVYRSFASAIEQRQGRGETQETTLVGIKEAEIVEADLTSNRMAEVTVRFVSELVNATRDKAGQLVGGNPNAVEETIDIWTFARNLRSSDPNWQLIATATPA